MRISSVLWTAALALSMSVAAGTMTTAFAADRSAVQQQAQLAQPQSERHQNANASPYDSPDFVVPGNEINS